MSLIRRAFSAPERRGAPGQLEWGSTAPPPPGSLGGTAAGTNVSEKTALQVGAVYGSIGVLTDSVSTLPIELYNSADRARRKTLPPSPLVSDPYCEISPMDWWVQFTLSLGLRGNFYGQIVSRDKSLYPTQIKPIHPDQVRVRRLPNGQVEYQFFGRKIPIEDVFHVRYLSVPGSLEGLNPIEYLRNVIGIARAADLFAGSWYPNSANPSGTIEVAEELDEEATLELAKKWMAAHQGIGQANLPAILTGGAEFKPITITADDTQFLASRAYSQGEISGMIFRVPPHMIGIVDRSTSWGQGIEQQELGFVRNTLSGYLVRAERALTALHPPGQFVRFDLDERLRGDKLSRYEAHSLGRLGGWLNADEIRAKEGEPPIPGGGGKEYLIPINSETLAEALLEVQAKKKAAEEPAPAPVLAPAVPNGNGVPVVPAKGGSE